MMLELSEPFDAYQGREAKHSGNEETKTMQALT
jgi:hypothetical protein